MMFTLGQIQRFLFLTGRGGVNKGSMLTILYNLMDGKEPHLNTR